MSINASGFVDIQLKTTSNILVNAIVCLWVPSLNTQESWFIDAQPYIGFIIPKILRRVGYEYPTRIQLRAG